MPAFVIYNLLSNYFWLFSIGISLVGLLVEFIGLCVLQANVKSSPMFLIDFDPGLLWWIFVVQVVVVGSLILSIVSTSSTTGKVSLFGYRTVFTGILSHLMSVILIAFGMASSLSKAASAGAFICLAVYFLWVIVLGAESTSFVSQLIYNNFSASGSNFNPVTITNSHENNLGSNVPVAPSRNRTSLENSVPSNANTASVVIPSVASTELKAKALYSFSASAEDPNEISFEKNEVFVVLNKDGKWWQVKKENGTVGIAPSNYLQLIS